MKKNSLLALVLSALVIATVFAAPPQRSKKSGGAAPSATASPAQPAAEVRVLDLAGLKKLLQREANENNSRPLLINFWATWCDPCREEFPDLVKIDNEYRGRGLEFVTISLDELTDIKTAVPRFLSEMRAGMLTYLLDVKDPQDAINVIDPKWGGALPATFLYDTNGLIIYKHWGRLDAAELRQALNSALKSETKN